MQFYSFSSVFLQIFTFIHLFIHLLDYLFINLFSFGRYTGSILYFIMSMGDNCRYNSIHTQTFKGFYVFIHFAYFYILHTLH